MDWFDLLAVQGSLKRLLQHHSSKASILWCSTFFIVQLSHPYMTTGKTIALTRRTFVRKVMSLLFNMLSRLVIAFLPRSKRLLISRPLKTVRYSLDPENPTKSCKSRGSSSVFTLGIVVTLPRAVKGAWRLSLGPGRPSCLLSSSCAGSHNCRPAALQTASHVPSDGSQAYRDPPSCLGPCDRASRNRWDHPFP